MEDVIHFMTKVRVCPKCRHYHSLVETCPPSEEEQKRVRILFKALEKIRQRQA